jgi:hypothetical protein
MRQLRRAHVMPFSALRDMPSHREVNVSLSPVAVGQATWADGTLIGDGNDPRIVFALSRPRKVYAIRLRFSYENTAPPAKCEFFWQDTSRNEFGTADRYYSWSQDTGPGESWMWVKDAVPGEKTKTVWIDDTIDRFRFDPDNKPCTVKLKEITLLVPSDDVISQTGE